VVSAQEFNKKTAKPMATALKDLSGTFASDQGRLSYNGIEFNVFRHFELSSEAVYDEAGWAVTHLRYTLSVVATIFADDESGMATLSASYREALNEPGRQLIIKGQGLGDIVVNAGGGGVEPTHYDVEWGPKPNVTKWNMVGGLQAAEVEWTCSFSISECAPEGSFDAQGDPRPLLALNYIANYRTVKGLTTRTISGYAQIPMTRAAGSPSVSASVDDFWDDFSIAVPPGFDRAENDHTLSSNRTRMDFGFVDVQLSGEPYPPNCVYAEAEYTLGNRIPKNFETWQGSLEATFEVAPGKAKAEAAKAYYGILLQTLSNLNAAAQAKDSKAFVMLDRIVARNSLFTRRASFSATFMATGCLESVLGPGGLWAPVGTNYQQWATSMGEVWGNRGTAQLRHTSGAIISLCQPTTMATAGLDSGSGLSLTSQNFEGVIEPNIPPDGGYIAYDCHLVAVRDHNIAGNAPLAAFVPPKSLDGKPMQGIPAATPKPEIQVNGPPTDHVLLVGKSMRAKYQPEIPRLIGIETDGGTLSVYEKGAMIEGPRVVGCYLGAKVYYVKWAILYKVYGYVTSIPDQPRPMGCCDDATG
jgi:hypothetical protein